MSDKRKWSIITTTNGRDYGTVRVEIAAPIAGPIDFSRAMLELCEALGITDPDSRDDAVWGDA